MSWKIWTYNSFLGDELTVEFVLTDHKITTQVFKVGEPEDNTQDKDDPATNTFTKYLLLKKTSVGHFYDEFNFFLIGYYFAVRIIF